MRNRRVSDDQFSGRHAAHRNAAASVSAMRPAAPARLIASKFIIVLQLPPVTCAPSTGSLNFGSFLKLAEHACPSSSRRVLRKLICAMVEAMC